MNTKEIITHLDGEIARLKQVKSVLTGEQPKSKTGRQSFKPERTSLLKKRTMSAAGRARIAAAQKARWAKAKEVA